MKIYLVQHGQAVSKDINPERPLSEKGKEDIVKLAHFLKKNNIEVFQILHSVKLRAKQTAQILMDVLSPSVKVFMKEGLSPNDPIKAIEKDLSDLEEDTIIVGHLPHLSKLCSKLLIGVEDNNIVGFKQGSIVCLKKNDELWQIDWFISPDLF